MSSDIRQALNQVSNWVESEQIKELEKELRILKFMPLFDWKGNTEGSFQYKSSSICLTFYSANTNEFPHIYMISRGLRKEETDECIQYIGNRIEGISITIQFGSKYAIIDIKTNEHNEHLEWPEFVCIMMQERAEKLIEFIDERRS